MSRSQLSGTVTVNLLEDFYWNGQLVSDLCWWGPTLAGDQPTICPWSFSIWTRSVVHLTSGKILFTSLLLLLFYADLTKKQVLLQNNKCICKHFPDPRKKGERDKRWRHWGRKDPRDTPLVTPLVTGRTEVISTVLMTPTGPMATVVEEEAVTVVVVVVVTRSRTVSFFPWY